MGIDPERAPPRSIDCPRCALPLEYIHAAPADGPVLVVEHCPRCGGLLIEGHEVGALAPDLSAAQRVAPAGGDGIVACPLCFAAPDTFDAGGTRFERCPTCTVVWLDGDDYLDPEARARLPRQDKAQSAYRATAREQLPDEFSCPACEKRVAVRGSYMTAYGAICGDCHAVYGAAQLHRDLGRTHTLHVKVSPALYRFLLRTTGARATTDEPAPV